jgi:hypothetical protein
VELPEEAEVVNLCSNHLTTVEESDLRFFERLSAVNAADNYFRMVSALVGRNSQLEEGVPSSLRLMLSLLMAVALFDR